eukprot:TRINITY_DN32027_c0_g1_i1.p1 TRINITY_DN32027_c0_g1~~TRINITY_DN32027_c0_g1_i1.p1  ORF type:complete len:513 (-),score=114.52 TRINITY_DN32027_c0_g1_i1:102-1508(-)
MAPSRAPDAVGEGSDTENQPAVNGAAATAVPSAAGTAVAAATAALEAKVSSPPRAASEAKTQPDPAVMNLAQWLAESLSSLDQRQSALAREVSAVREASGIGAVALVELRNAVQAQLEATVLQVGKLEQDLAATKLELAEVVIDKETNEGDLKMEIDALKSSVDGDMKALRSHFHEVQESLRNVLSQQVEEARQATSRALESQEREAQALRQALEKSDKGLRALEERELQRDAASKGLEERLKEGNQETMSYFHKIDKVMHDETNGVVPMLDDLRRARFLLERQSGETRANVERLRRDLEDCSMNAKRFQELHERLEPRVFHFEEMLRMVMDHGAGGGHSPTGSGGVPAGGIDAVDQAEPSRMQPQGPGHLRASSGRSNGYSHYRETSRGQMEAVPSIGSSAAGRSPLPAGNDGTAAPQHLSASAVVAHVSGAPGTAEASGAGANLSISRRQMLRGAPPSLTSYTTAP